MHDLKSGRPWTQLPVAQYPFFCFPSSGLSSFLLFFSYLALLPSELCLFHALFIGSTAVVLVSPFHSESIAFIRLSWKPTSNLLFLTVLSFFPVYVILTHIWWSVSWQHIDNQCLEKSTSLYPGMWDIIWHIVYLGLLKENLWTFKVKTALRIWESTYSPSRLITPYQDNQTDSDTLYYFTSYNVIHYLGRTHTALSNLHEVMPDITLFFYIVR